MSYKNQQEAKATHDLDFIDIEGPSTYKEIDHLFQEYCKVSSLKSRTPASSARKLGNTLRTLSGTSFAKPTLTKLHETKSPGVLKKPTWEGQISQSFLNQEKNFVQIQENENNNFASRVHSLIAKSNSSGWNMSEDDATQIANEFGISLPMLSTLHTHEEKHRYVVECLVKSVNDDLREFNKKHHVRQSHIAHFEEEYKKYKEKLQTDNADVFSWLKVKTPHEPLKKKLRSRLAETINDQENQSIIEASLEEIRNMSKDISRASSPKKIMLENIPIIDNIEILQGMLDGQSDNILKMTKNIKNAKRKQNESTEISQLKITTNNNEETDPQPDEMREWSPEKEHFFMLYRNDAKSRLFDKIKSSNWNELGFSPMMQASLRIEKNKLQRDTKLANYMNGDLLTPEEYKLLASTSVTLNRFVDRKYLQTVVNHLDPEVIEAIEIDIAEKTLKDHEAKQKEIKNSRLEYIKKKNQELVDQITEKDLIQQRKMKVFEGMNEQRRIKRKAISLINKIEEKKHWKIPIEQRVKEEQQRAVDIGHFADKFLKVVNNKVAARKLKRAQEFLRRLLPSHPRKETIDVEASRHAYHPSSKLIVKNENRSNDYLGLRTDNLNPAIAKRKNDSMDLYKLHIHSPPNLKDRRKFKSFYSGGPIDNEEKIFQGNYTFGDVSNYKVDKFQLSVIIRIQAAWRGYQQRKFFRQMQERTREKSRSAARMEYLKHNTESKFLRVVLQSQEKFQPKKHQKNKTINIDHIRDLPTSLSNVNSKRLDSGHRSSKVFNDLKTILHNDPMKNKNYYNASTPQTRELSKVRSFESIEDHFKNEESIFPKGKNENFKKIQPKAPATMSRKANSTVNLVKRRDLSGILKKQLNGNTSALGLGNEGLVEMERHNKITQRSAPKGLLLKQRKLFIAAKTNNFNIILSSGFNYFESDVNIKDDKGNTPLYYAAKNGDNKICDFLVRHKAFVNEQCSGGNTPLHMAFVSGQIMVVILLISNGGNLNVLNEHGQTPVAFGSERLLALLNLKDATATYNMNQNYGRTLPKEIDNNRFLVKYHVKGDQINDNLSFDYETLGRPLGQVMPENKDHHRTGSMKMRKRASIENNLGM